MINIQYDGINGSDSNEVMDAINEQIHQMQRKRRINAAVDALGGHNNNFLYVVRYKNGQKVAPSEALKLYQFDTSDPDPFQTYKQFLITHPLATQILPSTATACCMQGLQCCPDGEAQRYFGFLNSKSYIEEVKTQEFEFNCSTTPSSSPDNKITLSKCDTTKTKDDWQNEFTKNFKAYMDKLLINDVSLVSVDATFTTTTTLSSTTSTLTKLKIVYRKKYFPVSWACNNTGIKDHIKTIVESTNS